MFQIDDKLLSSELFDTSFNCDLGKCHGSCCIYGDAGAPLEDSEAGILEEEWANIREFLSLAGIKAIEKQGKWVVDTSDGEKVTPLIEGKECAYTVMENGIALCGIEKAFGAGKTTFQKPQFLPSLPNQIEQNGRIYRIKLSPLGDLQPRPGAWKKETSAGIPFPGSLYYPGIWKSLL